MNGFSVDCMAINPLVILYKQWIRITLPSNSFTTERILDTNQLNYNSRAVFS